MSKHQGLFTAAVLQIQSGGLNMRPFYQRSLVWDKPRASKLVVTALEGRLIPTIYLEEGESNARMLKTSAPQLSAVRAVY